MFFQPDIIRVIPSRQMRCGMWYAWGTREMFIWFWWGNLKESSHPGRSSHNRGKKTRIGLREIGWDSVACIHVAQNRDSWHSVVNEIMNLGFLLNTENLLTKWRAFQEGPYLVDLEFTFYIELSYEYTSSIQLWQFCHVIIVAGSTKLSSTFICRCVVIMNHPSKW